MLISCNSSHIKIWIERLNGCQGSSKAQQNGKTIDKDFISSISETSPEMKNITLCSFLILPVSLHQLYRDHPLKFDFIWIHKVAVLCGKGILIFVHFSDTIKLLHFYSDPSVLLE